MSTNEESSRFGLIEFDDVPGAAPQTVRPAEAPRPVQQPATTPPPAPAVGDGGSRLRRLYGFLQGQGINLHSMSTDQDVQRYLPRLREVVASLSQRVNGGSPASDQHLLVDVTSVMNRVPENRVTRESQAQSQSQAPVEAPRAQRGKASALVAVSKADGTTGAVAYWQLTGDVEWAKLNKSRERQGLPEDVTPPLASPAMALQRAVQELQARDVLTRKHPKGGWQIVFERIVNKELAWIPGPRLYLDDDDAVQVEASTSEEAITHGNPATEAREAFAKVRRHYQHQRTHLTPADVSAWLVKLSSQLHGVPLRERGGIYFIPRQSVDTLRKVKEMLASVCHHVLHEIPAMHSKEAIAAVLDAVRREAQVTIDELQGDLSEEMGKRAAGTRITEIDALVTKIKSYERLLNLPMADVLGTLKGLRDKLSTMQTRTNSLEVND